MSELDPVLAVFGLVSGAAAGLAGLAAGPVITPLFLLLYLGFKASAGV
ncbi:putative membrane protein YfcA [Devosia sp. UYZn731]